MRDAQSVILVVAAKTFNRLPLPEVLSFTSLSIWGYRERSALSLDYGRGDRSAYKILLPELLRGGAFPKLCAFVTNDDGGFGGSFEVAEELCLVLHASCAFVATEAVLALVENALGAFTYLMDPRPRRSQWHFRVLRCPLQSRAPAQALAS